MIRMTKRPGTWAYPYRCGSSTTSRQTEGLWRASSPIYPGVS
jgi:hypothetical protein